MDPRGGRALCQLQEMCSKGGSDASQTLALLVSRLVLNTGSVGRDTRCPAPRNHQSPWWELDRIRGGV